MHWRNTLQTIKNKDEEYHIGCEGRVIRGICIKCGAKKGGLRERIKRKIIPEGPWFIEDKKKLDEKAYKESIRRLDHLK
jgi:hypothetical protein